ncbi:MAG: hypothetical protein GOMPHAMPRED_007977 [Gomphillus americanus]|uniref:Uncharacterized protein n=1 Tax=Gomphillus americanus TaxID=1940652 RepID=A0A8H3IF59_9LECA|nr:MAG: hypothetical protein GOMPHAMPRED_007977 [Gomphillus americanus]
MVVFTQIVSFLAGTVLVSGNPLVPRQSAPLAFTCANVTTPTGIVTQLPTKALCMRTPFDATIPDGSNYRNLAPATTVNADGTNVNTSRSYYGTICKDAEGVTEAATGLLSGIHNTPLKDRLMTECTNTGN